MDIKSFLGKVVIAAGSQTRYIITEITSPYIAVKVVDPSANSRGGSYIFDTINGDPITNGTLVFENVALTDPFKKVYGEYCRGRDAYYEEIGYWMRKD